MKKTNKNNELRELILEKSVEIIAQHGVRGLSFREVARRADVSHQAPYHYFKNDSEILTAIARDGFMRLTQEMKEASNKYPHDALKALTASGISYVQFAIGNLGHFRVMFQRSLLPDKTLITDLPEADATHEVLRNLASKTIEAGFAQKMGLENLTMLCWSTVHGIASLFSEGLGSDENSKELLTNRIVISLSNLIELTKE